MTLYCMCFGFANWVDQCVDDYTKAAIENEFYDHFPELAQKDGFKRKDMSKKNVLTWPDRWACGHLIWSILDCIWLLILGVDMAKIYSFQGVTPSEWIFVLLISGHICFCAITLFFVVRRDKAKIRQYAKYRFQGMQEIQKGISNRNLSAAQMVSKMSFMVNETAAQKGAGVTRSMSKGLQKSFSRARSKSTVWSGVSKDWSASFMQTKSSYNLNSKSKSSRSITKSQSSKSVKSSK